MENENREVIVIYESKYGSTKTYASWIAEEIGGDLLEASKVKVENLTTYDVVVYGGSLHAVGIKGVKLITDNFERLSDKRLIVFGVGASPYREETKKAIIEHNFNKCIRRCIKFFYLRGAFNYDKLSFGDKMLMNALKLKLKNKKPEELDEDSKGLLECYDNPIDWTDKESILPIIKYIRREG